MKLIMLLALLLASTALADKQPTPATIADCKCNPDDVKKLEHANVDLKEALLKAQWQAVEEERAQLAAKYPAKKDEQKAVAKK